jgi:Glycoside hydrolase family 44
MLLLAGGLIGAAWADELVYGDELGPLWYSWSWTGTYDFTATSELHSGIHSIYAGMAGDGGFSLYRVGGFAEYSALRFWIEGDDPPIALRFEDTSVGFKAPDIPLDTLADVKNGTWTEVTLSLDTLPAGSWDRVSWVDISGTGTVIYLDDIELLDVSTLPAPFTSAEPVATDQIVLVGNTGELAVTVDGRPVDVVKQTTEGAPTRTYAQLAEPLGPGEWVVATDSGTYTRTLVSVTAEVGEERAHRISEEIYGANFPNQAVKPGEIERYGYSTVRWGGNARARYNPFERTTNLGVDWFFINELVNPSAETWLQQTDASVSTLITVPNLDWVADGTELWAYSVETYGEQQEVAPYNDDAGNGFLADGTPITWNDPADGSVPWTVADALDWLEDFGPVLPDYVAIGNETDIAHVTHRPVMPTPADFVDQRDRFLAFANAAKDAQPSVEVTGPVGCCWFFYWNSGDPADQATYGDFLPWFLDEVAAADTASGRRTLDLLDLHYYPEGLIALDLEEVVDPETNAWRLRMTRSLWDPTFVDDTWIGTTPPVTAQPDGNVVQLIPRLKALVDQHYPDTRLGLTEWSFGGFSDVSGGLAVADALGIFGAQGLDLAMIWPAPAVASPAASAFELLRTGDLTFGDYSLPVTGYDPDLVGIYAAETDDGRISALIVNKSPTVDLVVELQGVPAGLLSVEHFGGAVEERIVPDPTERFEGTLVVPAYSALLAEIRPDPPDEPSGTDGTTDTGTVETPPPPPTTTPRRCGCLTASPAAPFPLVVLALVALRRRRGPPEPAYSA